MHTYIHTHIHTFMQTYRPTDRDAQSRSGRKTQNQVTDLNMQTDRQGNGTGMKMQVTKTKRKAGRKQGER